MKATERASTETWTIHSLRPPTLNDAPFDTQKTGLVAAADVVVHLLPQPSSAWHRATRRFPGLPLEAELDRLCRAYNAETLSALARGLEHLAGRPRRRARNAGNRHATSRPRHEDSLTIIDTKHFANVQRKYRQLDLPGELQRLNELFPEAALFAIARALLRALHGHSVRGRPRLQDFAGVPAETRAFVQVRRLSGRPDLEIARCLEARLEAGQGRLSLRKRAQREVASVPRTPGRCNFSLAMATVFWAIARAERQIELVSRRFPITESQALACFEVRKSRFMSRALRGSSL